LSVNGKAGSVFGTYCKFGRSNDTASNSGGIDVSKTMSGNPGLKGVRVNAVTPGFVTSPILVSARHNVLKVFESRMLLNRLGRPRKIVDVVSFLPLMKPMT
jgi:3-oxoacyl-[acyl-carrier protein] reductase